MSNDIPKEYTKKYRVIFAFADKHYDGLVYNIGDRYPRKNYATQAKRIAELLSSKNDIGVPLIEEVEE